MEGKKDNVAIFAEVNGSFVEWLQNREEAHVRRVAM
jgi:hypothetical protein